MVKKNSVKENELITLIHEYFVYESFEKVGWLFTALKPSQPRIKYNEKLFRGVLTEKILHTFNDRNKKLFKSLRFLSEVFRAEEFKIMLLAFGQVPQGN